MILKKKTNQIIILVFFLSFLISSCNAEVRNIPDTAESQPFWSPDGQKILFSSIGVMSEGLFVLNPDGSEILKIRTGIDASWSPDGNILMINIFNGSEDIVLLDMGTQNINRLTYNENSLEEHVPKLSPTGEKIVFWGKDILSDINIYTINSDGTNLQKIVGEASSPEWSPDGKKIAFYTYGDQIEIWVINQDGTNKKRIFIDYQHRIFNKFKWTSDSRYLLLNNGSNTITKVNISDPTDIEYIYDPAAHWDPEYSPDGSYVTFVSDMDGGNPDLFVARSNGSDLYRLVYDTNPRLQNRTPAYFYKISRPTPPPWPTPEPTPEVTSTAGPANTSEAGRTPSIPGFKAVVIGVTLVSLFLIKKR